MTQADWRQRFAEAGDIEGVLKVAEERGNLSLPKGILTIRQLVQNVVIAKDKEKPLLIKLALLAIPEADGFRQAVARVLEVTQYLPKKRGEE